MSELGPPIHSIKQRSISLEQVSTNAVLPMCQIWANTSLRTIPNLRIVFTFLCGWKKKKKEEQYFVTGENDMKFKIQGPCIKLD